MSVAAPKMRRYANGLPRAPRIQLDSLVRVRREMASLYAEGKAGLRDVGDVSKLANVLALIGRILADHEFEARLERLEAASAQGGPQP